MFNCPHRLRRSVHKLTGEVSTCAPARCPNQTGADNNEIKSILSTLEPELEELALFHATLLYYYAYFLHNIFEESFKGKIDGAVIFDSKHELVDWIKTHYDDYFEKAYVEIEALLAKDAQSTFS